MSSNKVFLGNLNWRVTNDSLTQFLRNEGYEFRSVRVILDRDTNRSRGFAFVEFNTPEAAVEATAGLDGTELSGRSLRAFEAVDKPRGDRDRNNNHGSGSDRRKESEDPWASNRSSDNQNGWRSERREARRRNNDW